MESSSSSSSSSSSPSSARCLAHVRFFVNDGALAVCFPVEGATVVMELVDEILLLTAVVSLVDG